MLYVRAKDSHHDAHGTGNVEQNATELFDLPFGQFLEGIRDAEWLKAHAKDGGTRCRTSAKWHCPRSLTTGCVPREAPVLRRVRRVV